MTRPTFADPKTDFTFKRIFGSEEHKDVLLAFLNHILDLDGPHRIVAVELLPPEQRPAVAELKLSIVDVKCTDQRGVTYSVKLQVLQVEGFERCVVDNVGKTYTNQGARAEHYPGQNDVVGITISDFDLWPDGREPELPMLSRWRMKERDRGAKDLSEIRLVFLELPKYDARQPPKTPVETWAYFFRETDKLNVVPEMLMEHPFVDALEAMRIARFTVDEWDPYILSGMAIQNKRGALSFAEKRGRAKGLADAREEGRAEGMRAAVEAICTMLGVEVTEERRNELARLDANETKELIARLQQTKSWS
ncbi:MAG: Rpn family recombination-promoting nuclease/putative transposase [Polyangiaceae bacterium]